MAKHAARPPGKSGGHRGEVRWWGPYGPNPVIPAAEKSFGVRLSAARTPNRHRWSGREYQSDRANPGQGTRQITPVPSV